MIVVNDLCGDEDDIYLWCEYFKIHFTEVTYNAILNSTLKSEGMWFSNEFVDDPWSDK